MKINRFSPRKGIYVFTEPKFMSRVAMWGYSNQDEWNIKEKKRKLLGARNFPICFDLIGKTII